MKYDLFLFDLDDTLLDFKASEKLSFVSAMNSVGLTTDLDNLFRTYQIENAALWKQFEQGKTTKDLLKVERFRKLFEIHAIEIDPVLTANRYLDALPEAVVLIDHAVELCDFLSGKGELGIITNGIQTTQVQRLSRSKLAPFISFMAVSEEAGYAKPDVRFFEYTVKQARKFDKKSTLMVGDKLETDILGAHHFGIDSCWFNPAKTKIEPHEVAPQLEITHLSELRKLLGPGSNGQGRGS